MDAIKKAYAETSGGQVHYRYLAGLGTPIVFLHQTASSSAMYLKLMTRLEGIGPLYALDTPGFGGSFEPEGMPPLTQYVDWLAEAIRTIGLRRFHLLGHHTGAFIACELAARQPERIASLAMIGAGPLTPDERQAFRERFRAPVAPTKDGAYLGDTWRYLTGMGADRDLDLQHRELLDHVSAYRGRFQIYTALWDQDFDRFFTQVRCPILLMSAPDDLLHEQTLRAIAMRPDARHVLLKGANFEADLDPDGIAAAVRDFIVG
jgi:pimeloyl-ACP methyl ester carboxylesterase